MTPSGNPPAPRVLHAGLAFLAVLAALAVLPALHGEWILDDHPLIADNATVQALSWHNAQRLLTRDMWDLDVTSSQLDPHLAYYRPLVMLSYALDWAQGDGARAPFHVTNLLLHALTVLLAGRAVWRWTGSVNGALLAAAYFGLHPARAESVAWVSGRPDVLATLGMLTCLEGVARLRRSARASGAWLFGLGCLVAFGSKETALLLPMLVALELGIHEATELRRWHGWKAWPIWLSLGSATLYVLARQLWLPMRPEPVRGLSAVTHAGFVLETLGRAVLYLLAPFELSISGPVLTERNGHVAPEPGYVWLGGAVAVVLVALLLWTQRRKRRAFWALAAFVLSLLPVLNIVWIGGIGLTSPRFFYLPSLLLAFAAVEAGRGGFGALSPRVALGAGAISAACLALLLALQSAVYGSASRFWSSELRSRPDVLANIEYFAEQDWRNGDAARALARSLCEYRVAQQRFSFRGEGARIIMLTLDHWSRALPDAERGQLGEIANFLAQAREPEGSAVLRLDLSVEIPAAGKVRQRLRRQLPTLLTQEAELRARLGQPERALALLRQARAACGRCLDLSDRQAQVAYRAFDPDFAERLAQGTLDAPWGRASKRALIARLRTWNAAISRADGADRRRLEVQRAAELGLYGEASRLLERIIEDDPQAARDPEVARLRLTFAERAGDRALTVSAARALGVPPRASPEPLSSPRTKAFLAQLEHGCAFAEELR
jgi:hypothetical protein